MTTAGAMEAVTAVRRLALAAGYAGALRAAVQLGLADAIDAQPRTAAQLAAAVNADPDALARLLRALAGHGVFTVDDDGRYSHTDASRLLRADHPRSLRYVVLWATEPWTWMVWPRLAEAVRTGKGVFAEVAGKDFFQYLHEDASESAQVFDRAMTQASRLSADALAAALDLRGDITVADIAGGQGLLLATILERDPGPRGVLFDLPTVVRNADPRLLPGGALGGRTTIVAGDCRRAVPVRADVYVLKNVLEWDDQSTVDALRNVADAAPAGARVAIIENLIDGSTETAFTTAMDLLLMLNVNGKKHLKDDLVALVGQAGLTVHEVRPVGPFLHLLDCRV
jgi:C-methyltransferase